MDDTNADLNGGGDVREQYDEATEQKSSEFAETMRLIKEATGVSDINEVIAKFQSQGDTHHHLVQLQQANEARIEDLKAKKQQVLEEFEELKYTGESKQAYEKQMIQDFQKHVEASQANTLEAKQKMERAAKLLANSKAGIQHLADKLESIHLVLQIHFKRYIQLKPSLISHPSRLLSLTKILTKVCKYVSRN